MRNFARRKSLLCLCLVLGAAVAMAYGIGLQQHIPVAYARPVPYATPEGMRESVPLLLDFETVVSVPDDLRAPLAAALQAGRDLLPPDDRFTLTALHFSDDRDWAYIVLAPTRIVELGWEVDWWPRELIYALAERGNSGAWQVRLLADPGAGAVVARVPAGFMDFAALPYVSPFDYAFPWSRGQWWFRTWGWHSGDALDFQPVLDGDPYLDFAVLAAHPGRLTEICNDGIQSAVQVEHADGVTLYFHLDAASIQRGLLGQRVERGQFLGALYSGTAGRGEYNGWRYQFWTGCGGGTAHHLHFVVPARDVVIGGVEAATLAAGEPYVYPQYVSDNVRIDRADGP